MPLPAEIYRRSYGFEKFFGGEKTRRIPPRKAVIEPTRGLPEIESDIIGDWLAFQLQTS